MTSQEAREALEKQNAFMKEHSNKDIAAEMRERYPGIPPKLAYDLGIDHYTKDGVILGHVPTVDAQRSVDDAAGGLVAQAMRSPEERNKGLDGFPPLPQANLAYGQQPHPPQERYTRAEIRAMIDVALPEIKETQRARARDLSAERDVHGY